MDRQTVLLRPLRVLATAMCAFLILGLCATTAEARGVSRVSGVSSAGQSWSQAKLKVRWNEVEGATYRMRVASAPSRLSRTRAVSTRTAYGTYTRKLSRSRTYYVQVRAVKRGVRGAWSAPKRIRLTKPPLEVSVPATPPPTTLPATTPPPTGTTPPTTSGDPVTVRLDPSADSYAVSTQPDTNQGANNQLTSRAASPTLETFLRFELPAAPAGTTLTGASLQVRTSNDATAATTDATDFAVLGGPWEEDTITWNNRPTGTGVPFATLASAPALNTIYTVNGTPGALSEALGGPVTLRATGTGADSIRLWSRQGPGATYYPALTLTFTPTATPSPETPPMLPPTTTTAEPTPPVPAPTIDGRKVYAHYFPPYPVSLDNKPAETDYYATGYLALNGEGGKHSSYGGLLRDRPAARAPVAGADWRIEDLRTEVRQAKSAGIDGFTVNIMGTSGRNWDTTVDLMKAARDVGGFKVVPNVDANGSIASESPSAVAAKLAQLYSYSSAEVVDGEYLLSSFKAEGKSTSWWKDTITALEQTYDLPIKFIAVFLNASDTNMKAFAPISYALSNWGLRSVDGVNRSTNNAARAHALGRKWMEPVAFQDARPYSGVYAEASNTETGRATWNKAITEKADFVQIVTWNDYSESTQIAPSRANGSVFLRISAFYTEWFKTGKAPPITRDHLYVTHRIHPYAARSTSGVNNMSNTLGGARTPPRDTVEALVFLTAPAEVTVTSGGTSTTVSKPAGISAVTIPLEPGTVSASIQRSSVTSVSVTSPHTVTSKPYVPDFQYFAAGE